MTDESKIGNIFEEASRQKIRFPFRGWLSVEDLWDLKVQDLDTIFKGLNAKLKTEKEDSLLAVKDKSASELDLQIMIIRHIVGIKLKEAADREAEASRKDKKQLILSIINDKQNEELRGMSIEDLNKMVNSL